MKHFSLYFILSSLLLTNTFSQKLIDQVKNNEYTFLEVQNTAKRYFVNKYGSEGRPTSKKKVYEGVNGITDYEKIDGEYTLLIKLSQNKFSEVSQIISSNVTAYKLIRSENIEDKINVYFNISVNEEFNLQNLINDLKNIDNDIDFNMVESGVNW